MSKALDLDTLVSPEQTGQLDGWRKEVFEEFIARMTDKNNEFPCIFGVEAVTRGTLRYGFVSQASESQQYQLSRILSEFTGICESLGKRTSLVCFFEAWDAENTHKAYWEKFWKLLRDVAECDDTPWPARISRCLDDSRFEFTFNGQPMFVVVNTNLHQRRRSRRLSRVTITFQPRFVFDDIAEGTPRGDAARSIIRNRLSTYDSVPLPNTLGSFGDEQNREWIQYYLDDGDPSVIPATCPFKSF